MVLLLFFIHLLMTLADAAGGQAARCFECKDLPLPSFCSYTTSCAAGQQCMVEQVITTSGMVLYTSGCQSSVKCMVEQVITTSGMVLYTSGCQSSVRCKLAEGRRDVSGDATLSKRGDIIVCSECCEGDYCNNQGCGIVAMQRPNRGPYCFQCDYATAPDSCRTISTCDTGEVCMLNRIQDTHSTPVYRSSCKDYRACGASGLMLVGRKRDTSCHTCCAGDFCNDNCAAVTSSTVMPTTPTTSVATDTPIHTLTLTTTKSVTNFNLTSNTIIVPSEPVTSNTTSSASNTTAALKSSTATPSVSTTTSSANTATSSVSTATSSASTVTPSASTGTSSATSVQSAMYAPTTEPVTTRIHPTTTKLSTTPSHHGHFKDVCHHHHYHYDSSSQLCYRIHSTHRPWADADGYCRHEGARLAVVDNQAKWTFLVQHVLPHWYQNIYIGGRDIYHTDTYYWTNGARLQFNNWAGDQPDGGHENCVYLSYTDHWRWHDTSCPNHMAFICTLEKQ